MGESPWDRVFDLLRRHEDGLCLMALWETDAPLANGQSMDEFLGWEASERAVAERVAERMRALDGDEWSYVQFYRVTRGGPEPGRDALEAFLERCRAAGVVLEPTRRS